MIANISVIADLLRSKGVELPVLSCAECDDCDKFRHGIDAMLFNRRSILLWLCRYHKGDNLIESVEFVCQQGANVNGSAKTQTGSNALMEYCKRYMNKRKRKIPYSDFLKMTNMLLQFGLDINHRDRMGLDIMDYILAISPRLNWSQLVQILEIFLQRGLTLQKSTNNQPRWQYTKNTCVQFLATMKLEKFKTLSDGEALVKYVKLLVENGMNVNSVDLSLRNVAMLLCNRWLYNRPLSHGLDIVKWLVERGLNIHHVDWSGGNILHSLLQNKGEYRDDYLALVDYLITSGLDPNQKSSNAHTPLMTLLSRAPMIDRLTLSTVALLVRRGAHVQTLHRYENMLMKVCTRLDLTLEEIYQAAKVLIVQYRVAVRTRTKDVMFLFLEARLGTLRGGPRPGSRRRINSIEERRFYDLVNLFLKAGCNPNALFWHRETPLMLVCQYYDGSNIADVIRLLCKAGAKVTTKCNSGDGAQNPADLLQLNDKIKANHYFEALNVLKEYQRSKVVHSAKKALGAIFKPSSSAKVTIVRYAKVASL